MVLWKTNANIITEHHLLTVLSQCECECLLVNSTIHLKLKGFKKKVRKVFLMMEISALSLSS